MMNRIKWIDNARGLSVFCVLLAHCNCDHYFIYQVYTPWFLALFFFISGFLFKTTELKSDLIRLLRKLVLPYFILSFFIFFIGIDNWKALVNSNYIFLWDKVKDILLGHHLWFIPCIIMVQLYFLLLTNTIARNKIGKYVSLLLLFCSIYLVRNKTGYVAPYCCDIALFATSYFLLGNIVNENKEKIIKSRLFGFMSKPYVSLIILLFYLCGSLIVQNCIDMEFHFANNYYEKPVLFVGLSIFGIVSVSLVSNLFSSRYLEKLGANSLCAFAFNGKAYAVCAFVLNMARCSFNSYLYALTLCLLEGVLLIILSIIVNNYAPWLVGKKK